MFEKNKSWTTVASFCTLSIVIIGGAPSALADGAVAEEETHCVSVISEGYDPTKQACADSPEGIYQAAYDELGVIYDDGTAAADSFARTVPQNRGTAQVAQTTPLGTIYDDINMGGSSHSFSSTNIVACGAANPIVIGDLGTVGWNNRLSSFKGNVCTVTIFDGYNQAGAGYGPYWSSAWVGTAMNDKASSILFWN